MPKTKISEFSATPANNTDIDSINLAEGCAPSGINDAIRELMAQLKDFQTGAVGDSFNGPVGTTTAAAGAFTTLSSTGNTTLGDASGDSVTINGTATFANANPTLSAGTANGVAYLNGSKVVTSGSALTFSGSALGVNATSTDASMSIQALTANYASVLSLVANNDNGAQYNNISSSTSGGTVHWRIGGVAGTSQLPFSVGGSEQMRLTSTGLGIGTSSPASKLDVNSTASRVVDITSSNASGAFLRLVNSATALGYLGSAKAIFGTNLADLALDVSGANNLIFGTNDTERARIDSSGNLLVGDTSAVGKIYSYVNSSTLPAIHARQDGTAYIQDWVIAGGAMRAYIKTDGGLGNYSANNVNLSDERMKTDISLAGNYLEKICAIPVKTFKYKDQIDGELNLGVIAQDVEAVAPELVDNSGWGAEVDQPEDGIPLKAIYQTDLQYALMKCIQEQQAIIESLTARLDAANL